MATPKRTAARQSAEKQPAKKRVAEKRVAKKRVTKKRAPSKRVPSKRAPAKKRASAKTPARRARSGSRYLVHYDIDGPRVRLGLVWFTGAMVAAMFGTIGIGVYFAVAFGAAASHATRTWRARGHRADPRVALAATTVVVLAAIVAPWAMGVAMFGLVAAAIASGARTGDGETRTGDGETRTGDGESGVGAAVAGAGTVLQAALPAAVAGGCLVLLSGIETWAAVSLILLVSAYETGDYLIGSGSANAVEGPLAGGAAVFVVTLVVAALGFPPFGVVEAMVFGVVVAPLAFAGQILASAILPHARAFAPALRRVDSLLLTAPTWYVGVDLFVV